jgi:hypothetical protein
MEVKMLEKIKRKKKLNKLDITKPKTIDELIQKYDLENADIYDYLDYLADNVVNIEQRNTYSTNEMQVGTWVNGKTIYRRVFPVVLSSAYNNEDTAIANSIISDLEEIVSLEGTLKNDYNNWFSIPRINPNGNLNIAIGIYYNSQQGIVLSIGQLTITNNSKAYLVVEYTKTTS